MSSSSLAVIQKHLDWSDKQRRILTGNDNAEEYYVAERGFSFLETELPHYHLLRGDVSFDSLQPSSSSDDQQVSNPITGVWKRPLFYGGWEHSTEQDETVYNVQTNTLFIDLRIPVTKSLLFANISSIQSLQDMNQEQLRWFARQHIFCGYSLLNKEQDKEQAPGKPFPFSCTRHHCMDWNFVGVGRSRPNRWWIETKDSSKVETPSSPTAVWKEWAYATDPAGQHYYCERWESWEKDEMTKRTKPVVALRRTNGTDDGVILIVGDHFNYCLATGKRNAIEQKSEQKYGGSSLVGRVDAALDKNDLLTARELLGRFQGGHGRVSEGWKIDLAIEFWKEGSSLWTSQDISVSGDSVGDCVVTWKGETWNVFESNLETLQDLKDLLTIGRSSRKRSACS